MKGVPQEQNGKPEKTLIEDFRDRGGDPRLLERIKTHPALEIIRRLHQDELDKVSAAAVLTELNEKLGECRGLALTATRLKSIGDKAGSWINLLGEIQAGVVDDKANRELLQRKGVIIDLPEIYFSAACLIPYMASLKSKPGKRSSPQWKWIERWIAKEAQFGVKNLRQLWAKEVIHRKVWPSRTLLYALLSGAAVPLEQDKGGKPANWTLEWLLRLGRIGGRTERHPVKLKSRLDRDDRRYVELALRYVPLARWDFERMYPGVAARNEASDLLQDILTAEQARRIEALPARLRLRVRKFKGEKVDRKIEFKKELAKLIRAIPPKDRAYLKKVTRLYWRRNLAKRARTKSLSQT